MAHAKRLPCSKKALPAEHKLIFMLTILNKQLKYNLFIVVESGNSTLLHQIAFSCFRHNPPNVPKAASVKPAETSVNIKYQNRTPKGSDSRKNT